MFRDLQQWFAVQFKNLHMDEIPMQFSFGLKNHHPQIRQIYVSVYYHETTDYCLPMRENKDSLYVFITINPPHGQQIPTKNLKRTGSCWRIFPYFLSPSWPDEPPTVLGCMELLLRNLRILTLLLMDHISAWDVLHRSGNMRQPWEIQ